MCISRLSAFLTVATSIAAAAPAQQLLRSINGPGAGAQFGKACIAIGDWDGDGFEDLLAGAPGFNAGRGAIYCVSGAYLASGTGSSTLWSVAPPVSPGDQFGAALADVGDVTFDGISDFLVGQPGYDDGSTTNTGAVRLVDGSSLAVLSLIHDNTPEIAFGSSMAPCGDHDGDGLTEVAVGAPGPSPFFTQLFVLNGAWLRVSQINSSAVKFASTAMTGSGHAFAASLASGFDLNGDGYQEIVVGVPGWDEPGATDSGQCRVLKLRPTVDINGNLQWTVDVLAVYSSNVAGERLGQSVDAAHDYDGDGVVDVIAGAPNTPGANNTQPGRALVLSGAALVAQAPPYELYTLSIPSPSPAPTTLHFGAAVRASEDLNHDGVGDLLVGAPDYSTTIPMGPGKGAVTVFSGATGVRLGGLAGANNDRLGDTLLGGFSDLDADGFLDFAVGGSLSDAGGTDAGVLKCYRLFPSFPTSYCTAKTNSLGCVPSMGASGSASASSGAPFLATCSNVINLKNGLLFYGHQPTAAPFQGGFLCVAPPTVRTPVQDSGGSATGSDCTGSLSYDFNARIQSGVDATLVAGAEVFAQYWSRDPQSPSTTSLSNALRFLINP